MFAIFHYCVIVVCYKLSLLVKLSDVKHGSIDPKDVFFVFQVRYIDISSELYKSYK